MASTTLILLVIACTSLQHLAAYPMIEVDAQEEPSFVYIYQEDPQMFDHQRHVRSLQPGAPNFPMPGQQNQGGWKLDPSLTRDENGNTRGSVHVQHSGPNHQVGADWGKVVRGPGKAKPTYSIHGSWKW